MLLTQKTVVPHIPRRVYFRLAPISPPTTTAIVLIRFTQPRCSVWPGPPGGPYPINSDGVNIGEPQIEIGRLYRSFLADLISI